MDDTDWKLKLRYGKSTTPFNHYAVLGGGMMLNDSNKYQCRVGSAVMSMKVWALNEHDAAETFQMVGYKVGFYVDQAIEIYSTDPEERPLENSYGYDISFIP